MFIVSIVAGMPANAIDTAPTSPNKVTGPLQITGYSFSGASIRYVQIYNTSSALVSLEGWRILVTIKSTPITTAVLQDLRGLLEPGKHMIVAQEGVIDRPAIAMPTSAGSTMPSIVAVTLIAPTASNFNDETANVPTISASTTKETDGSNVNYYVKRDVSSSTGNYLSGFSFMLPLEPLKNDGLYIQPDAPLLQVLEIYADAPTCAPFETAVLCTDYVKLYNASTGDIDLSNYRLRTGSYGQATTSNNSRALSGTLAAARHFTIPISLSASGSWVWLEDTYGTRQYQQTLVAYPSNSGYDQQAWAYDERLGNWRWTATPTPESSSNRFAEPVQINLCEGLRLNEIGANVASENQFIEVRNVSASAIDLAGCKLQTNRSTVNSFVFPSTMLEPGGVLAISIADSDLTLTRTTSGAVYVLSSDGLIEVDAVNYNNLAEMSSWAYVDGQWQQTYELTPDADNQLKRHPDCSDGYVRNLNTGKCNKLSVQVSEYSDCGPGKFRNPATNRCKTLEAEGTNLSACDIGQFRNPETNRCRSIATTASLLTPCQPGQERNPATNRCRSTVTASGLKPCTANQERNPETNRCRNKSVLSTTDFPVESIAQTGEGTLGWWAFGGVGVLAAGYAGWEWRNEVIAAIRKIGSITKLGR